MKKILLFAMSFCLLLSSCDRNYDSPADKGNINAGIDDPDPKFYMQQYDPIKDEGQFWHPDAMEKQPNAHTYVYGVANGVVDANSLAFTAPEATGGLQYSLLCQSFSGVIDRGLADGRVIVGAWMYAKDAAKSYRDAQKYGKMAATWGVTPYQALYQNPGFPPIDGDMLGTMGRNYVLTDVVGNPESSVVAIVASHVHEAFIVDIRDEAKFIEAGGYTKVYDATRKTTADSWREFKDKCNNRALVVIPAQNSELADFAIANSLFVVNLNKKYNTSTGGQNTALFKEVLAWLQPNSPVYGWEPGVGEDEFVIPVSKSGNMMVATADYNLPYLSAKYKNRQAPVLAKIIDPHNIDYSIDKKFVSFYLSDGAHAGWMIDGFVENYYSDPKVNDVNMSFGVTPSNLCMMAPLQMQYIFDQQSSKSTLIESFGGGYYYSDDFGTAANRQSLLSSLAKKVASHMRQHRVKVLEQIAHDPRSVASMEAYQAFVDANNQLEGIVAIQYAPSYAQCDGDIMWVTNKEGYDIPIITVRYSIWNMGNNTQRDGTPTFVARKLREEPKESKFSAVIVHAWSAFTDTGTSTNETAENAEGGTIRGASAAEMCARRLTEDIVPINMQEMIWRVRMHYRPEQTKKFLTEYY